MSTPTPLQYIIRVKDDGSAVIERFNRNITQGLNQVPPAANAANNAVNRVTNALQGATRAAGASSSANSQAALSWSALASKVYLFTTAARMVTSTIGSQIKAFNTYEDSLARLRALTLSSTGGMGKGFDDLRQQSIKMSETMRYSATDINNAMSFMKQFGLSDSAVSRGIKTTIDLATNELLNVEQASRIALAVQTSLGEGSEDLSKAIDTLTVASAESGASLVDLGEAWKYVGVNPRLAGVTLEETAATLMSLADAGIRGSMAGTTLRAAFNRLHAPTGAAKAALQELGLVTETGEKRFTNFIDVLKRLEKEVDKSRYMKTIFGERAMTGLTAISEDMDKFFKQVERLAGVEGRTSAMAAEKNKGLAGATDRLYNAFDNLRNQIVTQLSPGLKTLADGLATSLNFVRGMVPDLNAPDADVVRWGTEKYGKKFASDPSMLDFMRRARAHEASARLHPGTGIVEGFALTPNALVQRREDELERSGYYMKKHFKEDGPDQVEEMKRWQETVDRNRAMARRNEGLLDQDALMFDKGGIGGVLEDWKEPKKKEERRARATGKSDEEKRVEAMMKISQQIREEIGAGQRERRIGLAEGRDEMFAMKAEDWMPESELEMLADRMDSVNSIFANAANANEQIMFEQSSRSHANLLRLTKLYGDAAKTQVGMEKAKQNLLFGIAFEGVKAMTDVFVHGNEGRFKAMKAIASAEALVNTYLAVTQVLATPGLDPFSKTAAATAIGVIGLAKVASINQTEMGSTGGGPADSGLGGVSDFSGGGFDNPFVSSPSGRDVVLNGSGRAINVNINVDGFVGSEANLASKISEVLREAVGDDLNPGLTVSRGRRS